MSNERGKSWFPLRMLLTHADIWHVFCRHAHYCKRAQGHFHLIKFFARAETSAVLGTYFRLISLFAVPPPGNVSNFSLPVFGSYRSIFNAPAIISITLHQASTFCSPLFPTFSHWRATRSSCSTLADIFFQYFDSKELFYGAFMSYTRLSAAGFASAVVKLLQLQQPSGVFKKFALTTKFKNSFSTHFKLWLPSHFA